eukprot:SAG31_NODE_103_length_25164_cov_12.124317_18_plen_374_part_00
MVVVVVASAVTVQRSREQLAATRTGAQPTALNATGPTSQFHRPLQTKPSLSAQSNSSVPVTTLDSVARPLSCGAVHSTASEEDVCVEGAQALDELWRDRHYGWVTAPADILDGQWTYMQVAMEHSQGAPCNDPAHPDNNGREGGFKGTTTTDSIAAICCANHCGSENTPVDNGGDPSDSTPVSASPTSALSWTVHPGTYAISDHDGQPCTFYETQLPPGTWHICCSSCWASGVFFAQVPGSGSGDGDGEIESGPVDCSSLHPTAHSECVPTAGAGIPLWSDREYSFTSSGAPGDILDGLWSYVRVALERPSAPCELEGGFEGTVDEPSVVAICCANVSVPNLRLWHHQPHLCLPSPPCLSLTVFSSFHSDCTM